MDFGINLKINGLIRIRNHGTITIGDNVTINSGFYLNPIGGHIRTVLITHPQAKIQIGNNVGISNSICVSRKSITIKDNALIGGGCTIFDSDFHSLDWRVRGTIHDKPRDKEVLIGAHSFVGAYCILTKGTTIPEKAIVPAGSHGRITQSKTVT